MKRLHEILFRVLIITLLPLTALAQNFDWANDPGGIFNIPPVEYNDFYHGYGSTDNVIYNKIDLHTGKSMEIKNPNSSENNVPLYNASGIEVDQAWNSPIGKDHGNITSNGYTFRDGGIIAASIANVKVGNTTHKMIYAWSVNTRSSGRRSGWMKLSDLTPSSSIQNILEDNKVKRLAILRAGGADNASFDEYTVVRAELPSFAKEYYLDPGRDASKTAGKARFYYTVDEPEGQYISGLKNIPETGSQRFGVANNNFPLGAKFYRDMGENVVEVAIYPPSSFSAIDHKLKLVWGYSLTSAGEKIYSFINEEAIEATGNNNDDNNGSRVVHITKRNSTGFAIDGRTGAANNQNIHLWTAQKDSVNQQWIELDRGNGYYSYQKLNSNHCIDGGGGGVNTQNVKLWTCSSNNQNQHWKKVATDNGAFKLIKRNASGYAINGGSNGAKGQNVNLYDSSNSSHNLQWFINSVSTNSGNIAPEGTASQSSTAFGGSASKAIDGNINGKFWDDSVTHTSTQNRPYWQVKWNNNYVMDEIKIYNRTDCCSTRLSDFTVSVLNSSGNTVFTQRYTNTPNPSLTINTGGVTGSHVKVQSNGNSPLSLAEVQVYGSR